MERVITIVGNTWQLALVISSALFLVYLYNYRSKIVFPMIAGIFGIVQGMIAALAVVFDTIVGPGCCPQNLERGFLLLGATITVWNAILGLKKIILKSQPH